MPQDKTDKSIEMTVYHVSISLFQTLCLTR